MKAGLRAAKSVIASAVSSPIPQISSSSARRVSVSCANIVSRSPPQRAKMSSVLLAAMPAAGVGLGGLIGVDPAPVLLRTRLGAACLLGAVALQLGGLAWATRLSRIEVPT